jgi:hypothetical protein
MRTNIARSLWVVAALGAGCGNVMSPGAPDAAKGPPDAAAPDAGPPPPDAPTAMGTSCAQIKIADPAAPSGQYVIDPDGAGGAAPFSVICVMGVQDAGWTQVTDQLASSLSSSVRRQYLYMFGNEGYISPCTTDAWTWANGSGQELVGNYAHFSDTGSSTVVCNGSTEKAQWGVGCSNGPGGTDKVLPAYVESPSGALTMLCVTGECEQVVVMFEKEGC